MQPSEGYERKDADIRRVFVMAGVLVAVILLMVGVTLWAFVALEAREARGEPMPSTLAPRPSPQLPPEPRLQQDPLADLRQMRAEEESLLSGYGWVDRKAGIARIPVDRAMELVVQRGLPARPDPGAPAVAGR